MSMVLNNGFCEMTENEMMELEGGGWFSGVMAFVGGVGMAASPALGLFFSPGTGMAVFSASCAAMDWACNNVD